MLTSRSLSLRRRRDLSGPCPAVVRPGGSARYRRRARSRFLSLFSVRFRRWLEATVSRFHDDDDDVSPCPRATVNADRSTTTETTTTVATGHCCCCCCCCCYLVVASIRARSSAFGDEFHSQRRHVVVRRSSIDRSIDQRVATSVGNFLLPSLLFLSSLPPRAVVVARTCSRRRIEKCFRYYVVCNRTL